MPRDTWACAPVLSFILTRSLYMRVPGLQGTDSGPRAHPQERLRTRRWGQHPFPCSLPKFCTLGF
jgi:hypothetical protein